MADYGDFVPSQRFEPAVAMSPDGRHVAYSSNASGQFNLYVQPVDGGMARQLTSFTGSSVRQMAWSGGGAGLVFTADRDGDEQRQVYQVAADGSGLKKLTSGGQWSLAYQQSLDWVDPARMAVYGRSYGGFAALSCLSRLPGLWAAGVSVCGPSDLVALAAVCPPAWRPNVDRVLGNPDRDAAHLRQRSPLTYASSIKAPLLIIQGRQDPRVPETTSAQIAEALRANGTAVRYQVYDDEGHDFTNRANELHAMTAVVAFLTEHLQP